FRRRQQGFERQDRRELAIGSDCCGERDKRTVAGQDLFSNRDRKREHPVEVRVAGLIPGRTGSRAGRTRARGQEHEARGVGNSRCHRRPTLVLNTDYKYVVIVGICGDRPSSSTRRSASSSGRSRGKSGGSDRFSATIFRELKRKFWGGIDFPDRLAAESRLPRSPRCCPRCCSRDESARPNLKSEMFCDSKER